MADKKYSVDDILRIFSKLEKKIEDLACFVKECCAKIPVNVGTGIGLFKKFNQNKWEFKSLLPGNNITITQTNNEVVISSTFDCDDIKDCIGITPTGNLNKYLNEQGNFITITVPPNFIDSVSDTSSINLTVTGTTLSANFINNAGYITLSALSGGTGISYNNLTGVITNTAPDQTVVLTQAGTTTITGTYPNFTISSADQFTGTVTSVSALTLGTSGTDLSSTVANSTTTPVITLNVPTASATNRGVLSSADWSKFTNSSNLALNQNQYINLFDDFIGYNTAPSNLGAAGTLGTNTFTIVKGANGAFTKVDNTVLRFRSSSNGNTNNYGYFGTINVGLGTLELEYLFKRLDVGRGHDIYIGLFDQLATINPTNMIGFIYQRGTNILTTNTRNSGGTETNNISTFTGDVWNNFKIVIDSNASSVQFYLNGNLESTHTNFIPDSSISLFNEFGLNSTASSFTVVGFDVDYASIKYNLTTPR